MSSTLMSNITRSNIKNNTTAEFLTSFEWDFKFTRLPAIFGDDANSENYKNVFRLRANSVVTPEEPVNNPIAIEIRGQRYSQPGLVRHDGSFSFILQDFADVAIQKPLMNLMYEMCNPVDKSMKRAPQAYQFDCKIYQLNSAREVVKVWICKDCQLVSAAVVDDMNGEKSPVGQTTVTFTTDFYTVEYSTGSDDHSAYYSNKSLADI